MIFEVPLNISPIKDTINLGDTLVLQANFPDTVKELNSGKYYRLQNFDFKTRIGFFTFHTNSINLSISQQPGAGASFVINNEIEGVKGTTETFGDLVLSYDGKSYKAKTKLIPKQRGVYAINFYSRYINDDDFPLDFINVGIDGNGNKRIALMRNVWYTVNEGQTNFDLYRKNTKTGDLNSPQNRHYEMKSTYTFAVR